MMTNQTGNLNFVGIYVQSKSLWLLLLAKVLDSFIEQTYIAIIVKVCEER